MDQIVTTIYLSTMTWKCNALWACLISAICLDIAVALFAPQRLSSFGPSVQRRLGCDKSSSATISRCGHLDYDTRMRSRSSLTMTLGDPYTAVMIVPTGIGASIGGYAGDALPSAR